MLRVALVESGRGLIEDKQLHVLGQGFGDLDELLLADPDVAHLGVGVLREPDPGEELTGLDPRAHPVDHTVLGDLIAEEDVLGDRELGDEG